MNNGPSFLNVHEFVYLEIMVKVDQNSRYPFVEKKKNEKKKTSYVCISFLLLLFFFNFEVCDVEGGLFLYFF